MYDLTKQFIKFSRFATSAQLAVPVARPGFTALAGNWGDLTASYEAVDVDTREPISDFIFIPTETVIDDDVVKLVVDEVHYPDVDKCFRLRRYNEDTQQDVAEFNIVGVNFTVGVPYNLMHFDVDNGNKVNLDIHFGISASGFYIVRGYVVVKMGDVEVFRGAYPASDHFVVPEFKANGGRINISYESLIANTNVTINSNATINITKVVKEEFSNPLIYKDYTDNGVSFVSYWCNEDEFDIPFGSGLKLGVSLPILLTKPQYKQTDEVYEKLNGEKVVLYATSCKEYELQTEYIPEGWHDLIMQILLCDHILIEGKSLYKSAEYSIDWEKVIEEDNGKKLARATCKMQMNINSRNSN